MANYKSFAFKEGFYVYIDKLQFDEGATAIIGSGLAALAILEKSNFIKNTIIFEQGNHFDPQNYQGLDINNASSFALKTQTVEESLGGSSNTWTGRLSEMTEYEFQGMQPKDGLIDSIFKDLQKVYYQKAWKFFNFKPSYSQTVSTKGNFEERVLPAQKKPLRVAKALKKIPVQIILNQKVLYVGTDSDGSFLITSFDGQLSKKCYFKKIIIATGGIQSINLINRSIEMGFMKSNPSLTPGAGYMNHPKFSLINFTSGDKNSSTFQFPEYYSEDFIAYSLSDAKKNKLQASNTFFTFQPVYEDEHTNEFLAARNLYANKKSFFKYFSKHLKNSNKNIFVFTAKFIKFLLFFLRMKLLKVRYYNLLFFLEMEALSTNYISENMGKINVSVKLSNNDIQSVKKLFSELVGELGSSNINKDYVNLDFQNIQMQDASHHIGGLSMNNNKELSFVDKNLQLNCSPNIYICSSSVFPRSGSCNPTLTIVALGLRLGDHLNS